MNETRVIEIKVADVESHQRLGELVREHEALVKAYNEIRFLVEKAVDIVGMIGTKLHGREEFEEISHELLRFAIHGIKLIKQCDEDGEEFNSTE